MLLIMLYGIYSIKYYYFIINENNFSLMSQLRLAPTTDLLDLLVDHYNNAIHSSIKMTPKEASREENEHKFWKN